MDSMNMDINTTMMDMNMATTNDDLFCHGSGMGMYGALTFGLSGNQPCLTFLFVGWSLNTVEKYAGAMIGVFLLAVSAEALGWTRQRAKQHAKKKSLEDSKSNNDRIQPHLTRLRRSVLRSVQSLVGYIVMLAVMSFSVEFLIMALAGLGTGHFLSATLWGAGCRQDWHANR